MTKYSNIAKKPGSYMKGLHAHWKERRAILRSHAKRHPPTRRGAVNQCWKPSNEASKADLAEYHREEMRLRKARRRKA